MLDDDRIAEEVKRYLEKTRSVGLDVHYSVRDGVVELKGVVDVLAEKESVAEGLCRIEGVRGVKNGLTVGVDSKITDKHIELELIERLQGTPAEGVTTEVRDGVVYLRGDSSKARAAMEIARSTRGVKEVVDLTEEAEPDPLARERNAW